MSLTHDELLITGVEALVPNEAVFAELMVPGVALACP